MRGLDQFIYKVPSNFKSLLDQCFFQKIPRFQNSIQVQELYIRILH